MDEDLSDEYSENFDSFISHSSKNIKSVVTEIESIRSCSIDTDCLSQLSTERSGRLTESRSSIAERTPNLSASRSALRFSRYFSESEKYSADFVASDAELNTYRSSFESLTGDGSADESDKDTEDLTVFSAASNTDTQTYSSVSQDPSIRWKDNDEVDEFSSDSQQLTSKYSGDVFR